MSQTQLSWSVRHIECSSLVVELPSQSCHLRPILLNGSILYCRKVVKIYLVEVI